MFPLLLLSLLVATHGQRSCVTRSGPVPHGTAASVDDCQRHTCHDGVTRVDTCDPVPVGCTAVAQDPSKPHPDCCTRWCCGSECPNDGPSARFDNIDRADGGVGAANLIQGCFDGSRVIAHGESFLTRNCTKITCVKGSIRTEVCPAIPSHCHYTAEEDRSKGYPYCCPTFCCGDRCPPAPGQEGSAHCIFNGAVLRDGYSTYPKSGCTRTRCDKGRLVEDVCSLPDDDDCVLTFLDQRAQYPNCCPHHCCGLTCAVLARKPKYPPLSETDCLLANTVAMPSGSSHQTPQCEVYTCANGQLLRPRTCRPVPRGCAAVRGDRRRPFPHCCDLWHASCLRRQHIRTLDGEEAEEEELEVCSAEHGADEGCVRQEELEGGELINEESSGDVAEEDATEGSAIPDDV